MPERALKTDRNTARGWLDRPDGPATSSTFPPVMAARFDCVAFLRHVLDRVQKKLRVGASGLIDGLRIADSSRRSVARGIVESVQTRVIA